MHEFQSIDGLRDGDVADFIIAVRDHFAELAFGDQLDCAHTEACAEDAIERGWRAAALEMTEDAGARLFSRTPLDLTGNPFADATPAFLAAMAAALSLGLGRSIVIDTPFAALHKADVIRKGIELGVPLELTLSCMQPENGMHCGRCSKCRERRDAFREAGVEDPTLYRQPPIR